MTEAEREGADAVPPRFTHFTAIADGSLTRFIPGHSCQPGLAIFGVKMWAESAQHAAHMLQAIAKSVGFVLKGRAEFYKSAPVQPCGDKPFGYDLQFTNYDAPDDAAKPKQADPSPGNPT